MKTNRKLTLKKEVVTSLTNQNRIRAGATEHELEPQETWRPAGCKTTIATFYSNCACETMEGPCTAGSNACPDPPQTGGCGATGGCTCGCATMDCQSMVGYVGCGEDFIEYTK